MQQQHRAATAKPLAQRQRGSSLSNPGSQLVLLGMLGVILSSYGPYVDYKKRTQAGYVSMCESCSNVMSSKYGHLLQYHGLVTKGSVFDVSNTVLGMLAYSLFILYPVARKVPYHQHFYAAASAVAVALSVYLAYILSFVLRDFCIVCVVSYFINAALLWNSVKLVNSQSSNAAIAKKKVQ